MAMASPTRQARPALATIPLFDGISAADLDRLEHFMARFEIGPGETLFEQYDASACMHLIERGKVEIGVQTPDGTLRALAQVGAGGLLGEISLLHGGTRSATATALEPTAGWVLYRAALQTLRIDAGAGSVEVMARLAELAVARLRRRYEQLAAELGADAEADVGGHEPAPAVPADPALWTPAYLHSLLCFRSFHDERQVKLALDGAVPYELPPGVAVCAPDGARDRLLVVIRGAVDVSARCGATARRVRLAGPGRFVGHVGVLDEGPRPVVARSRGRVVLLALDGARVRAMRRDPSAVARRLTAAIAQDTARAVRHAERPIARTHTGSVLTT